MKNKFVILLICSTLLLAGVGCTIAYEVSKNSSDEWSYAGRFFAGLRKSLGLRFS